MRKHSIWLTTIALGCKMLSGQDMCSSVAQASILMVSVVRQQEPKTPAGFRFSPRLAPSEPFTASQRWAHYVHRTYSAPRLGLLAAESAMDHALREPACWDRGGSSYARRYTRAIERRVIRNTAEVGAGLLTGEDLRYFPSRSVRPSARAWHAVRSAFLARMPGWSTAACVYALLQRRSRGGIDGALDRPNRATGMDGPDSCLGHARPNPDQPPGRIRARPPANRRPHVEARPSLTRRRKSATTTER